MTKIHNHENKPKSTNEITNTVLKETISNKALEILQEDIDYINLAYTKVEFGYLFDIENRGIESLFKVITDKQTAYFAIQATKMMRVNLSEELFQLTTDTFLNIHS